jgi:hypothetical protein
MLIYILVMFSGDELLRVHGECRRDVPADGAAHQPDWRRPISLVGVSISLPCPRDRAGRTHEI